MRDFTRLEFWKKAHQLTMKVYAKTDTFPDHEIFGLTRQLRRSCVSVGSNIAEGCGRQGDRELRRFLNIAAGSLSEVQYQLLVARDLDYLETASYERLVSLAIEIRKMLYAYIKRLR